MTRNLAKIILACSLLKTIVVAQAPGNPTCFVCGSATATIANPGNVIPLSELGVSSPPTATCQQMFDGGKFGFIPAEYCPLLQESNDFKEFCGCEDPNAPKPTPIVPPKPTPIEPEKTLAPTRSPTSTPTPPIGSKNTSGPSFKPTETEGLVVPQSTSTPSVAPTTPIDVQEIVPVPGDDGDEIEDELESADMDEDGNTEGSEDQDVGVSDENESNAADENKSEKSKKSKGKKKSKSSGSSSKSSSSASRSKSSKASKTSSNSAKTSSSTASKSSKTSKSTGSRRLRGVV